ncbi:MAG: hypothetical protein ACK46X_05000 [Candidatus Sericytochromatia bacterium]
MVAVAAAGVGLEHQAVQAVAGNQAERVVGAQEARVQGQARPGAGLQHQREGLAVDALHQGPLRAHLLLGGNLQRAGHALRAAARGRLNHEREAGLAGHAGLAAQQALFLVGELLEADLADADAAGAAEEGAHAVEGAVRRVGLRRIQAGHAQKAQVLDAELGAAAGLGDQQALELVHVGLGVAAGQARVSHRLHDRDDAGGGELTQVTGGALGSVQGSFDNAHDSSFCGGEKTHVADALCCVVL